MPFQAFQALLFAAVCAPLIAAWLIGRRRRKVADQKLPGGNRAAIILLRVQTLVPFPWFIFDNLDQATLQRLLLPHAYPVGPGQIIFLSALIGEALTVPVIWLWVRNGQGAERIIAILTSVFCAFLIPILVLIGGATA